MGIHVSLYKLDGTKHPEWDCLRYSGDRDIPGVVGTMSHCEQYSEEMDERLEWPCSPDKFVAEMIKLHPYNEQRWRTLGEALKQGWRLSYSF